MLFPFFCRLFSPSHAGRASLLHNDDLIVVVSVQLKAVPGRRVYQEKRNADAMLFADKLMKHPDKWQLFSIDHAHDQLYGAQLACERRKGRRLVEG